MEPNPFCAVLLLLALLTILFKKSCNVGVEDDEDPPPIALSKLAKSVCNLLALVPAVPVAPLAPVVPATLVSKLLKKFCNVGDVDEVEPPIELTRLEKSVCSVASVLLDAGVPLVLLSEPIKLCKLDAKLLYPFCTLED